MIQATQAATFLEQNRLYNGNLSPDRENCFPPMIACLLGLDDPEAVFLVQDQDDDPLQDSRRAGYRLQDWLGTGGVEWRTIEGHCLDGSLYIVIGKSHRGSTHVCLYQFGNLVHDPHPDKTGLVTETYFQLLEPLG